LAVVLGVSTSILKGDEERMRGWIFDIVFRVAPQLRSSDEFGLTLETVVSWINQTISNVHSGKLGTVGVLALLGMILFMLARIEETLNDIWGVSQGRSWYARMVNYWAAISLGPIVIAAAISFPTTLRLPEVQDFLGRLPIVGSLLIGLLPIPVLGAACALFYGLMPNTRVPWRAAMVGGLAAGILWHLNNTLSVHFVAEITRNSAIYGSLGIVPVVMVGLYFFWMLLLFGAQVAYTFQHRKSYAMNEKVEAVHQAGRELVALRVMVESARAFAAGHRAPTASSLAERLEVPGQLIRQVTGRLVKAGLLIEVAQQECGYAPARPLDEVRVADVLEAMRRGLGRFLPTSQDAWEGVVKGALDGVRQAEHQAGQRTLLELARAGEHAEEPRA
jgi:membrane protein